MKSLWSNRFARWACILVALCALGGAGYYVARKHAWPTYERWREARLNRMARDFFAQGRYDETLVTVRRNLTQNQRNLESWQIGVQAAKAKNAPDAVYYQSRLTGLRKTLDNQLELIRLALQYKAYRYALDTINDIVPQAKNSADFHRLAADTYLVIGRRSAAKYHLYSLLELRPDNRTAALEVAEIELLEDTDRKRPELREKVATFTRDPELGTRASLILLRDANARSHGADSARYASQLQAATSLSPAERVMVLEGLVLGAADRAADYQRRMESDFAGDPDGAATFLFFLHRKERSNEARTWFETLPESTRSHPRVQRAVSESLLVLRDWSRLDQITAGSKWVDDEYLRYAFITFSARQRERANEANQAWKLAMIEAGDNVRNVTGLLERAHRWGWEAEKHDLINRLFALMPRNEKIAQSLIAWEREQGKTANLNRLFARLVEANPQDRQAKNNFAYTSLLLDSNVSRALLLAREVYQAEPRNPFYVTTQAFALYKQGKAEQAMELLESLGAGALSTPERALLRGVLRAANGDAEGAVDFLAGLDAPRLLPEERKLLGEARQQIAQIEQRRGSASRLLALRQEESTTLHSGELRVLPASIKTVADHDIMMADALLATGNVSELAELLRRNPWGAQEHLRLALTSYTSRQQGEINAARSFWRSAIGNAGRDPQKLSHLVDLAGGWQWKAERMEALERAFDRQVTRESLVELIDYHRSGGRTADLVRVLNVYVTANPDDRERQGLHAYYSMLSGLNVSRAYVTAQQVYEATPDQPTLRLAYAFALWKQKRAEEAWSLLRDMAEEPDSPVPAKLLRAAIALDTDRAKEAVQLLESYDASSALPEETGLAATLRRRLAEQQNRLSAL